jgi:hypothetical protein
LRRLARNDELPFSGATNQPVGQITSLAQKPVQPSREKYSALFLTQISCVFRASRPMRGALRTSRHARWDAVAVALAKDDRKRSRTVKSCGPDAPMAGVKLRGSVHAMTVTNKPGLAGESTK